MINSSSASFIKHLTALIMIINSLLAQIVKVINDIFFLISSPDAAS